MKKPVNVKTETNLTAISDETKQGAKAELLSSDFIQESPVVTKIPFTNQLNPKTFLRLKQFECWGGMEIQEILEEALTAFFADKPEADRELPIRAKEKLRKKLPNI